MQEGFKEQGNGCVWGQITCPKAHVLCVTALSQVWFCMPIVSFTPNTLSLHLYQPLQIQINAA